MAKLLKLSKGDKLIVENDASNSLYFLQSGALRVFKKKGNGFIELGIISEGSIVGELSFFDNQRRSASVEAMRDCEVIEVPRSNFDEFVNSQPAWAGALLKTMSSKVRGLTDRVKDLENESVATKVDANNKLVRQHEFLLARDVIKLISALIVCATFRGARDAAGTVQVPVDLFQVLAAKINTIAPAKTAAFVHVFKELGLLELLRTPEQLMLGIRDMPTLGNFFFWFTNDTAKACEFKKTMSKLGVQLGEAIWASEALQKCPKNREYQQIDLRGLSEQLAIRHSLNSELYMNIFDELSDLDLANIVKFEGKPKQYEVHAQRFLAEFPMLRIKNKIDALNELKRHKG